MQILIINAIDDRIVNMMRFLFIKLWTINIKSGIKLIIGKGITDNANNNNSVKSNGSANSFLTFAVNESSLLTKF